jgi:cytochrome bd ubiquinol oxidase subunit II
MNPTGPTLIVGAALFATMAGYALFAGADFGGGIWDLLAGGDERGREPREAIDRSVTPVWEGNHVWIVLGFVFLWTGFPTAFAAIMTSLFVPLSLSLLGILLRGIGFAFRHEAERLPMQRLSGFLFAASSVIAPFFLGAAVGAVATGRVRTDRAGNVASAWVNPTSFGTGVLFVAACAYISGLYLIGDSQRRGEEDMVRYFSRRSMAAGVITGLLAAGNLLLLRTNAHYVYSRVTGVALPLVIVSVVAGLAAFVLILLRRTWLLRICGALAVVAVVAAYGVAQYPYLLPRSLTVQAGAAPRTALEAEIVVLVLAALLVAPSFAYLYWLQQHGQLQVTESSEVLRKAAAIENRVAEPDEPGRPHPVVATVVIGAAGLELAREAASRLRRRPSLRRLPFGPR